MEEYYFCTFSGHVSKSKAARVEKITKKYGAWLVTCTHPQCRCGYGCAPDTCPKSKSGWLATENDGDAASRAAGCIEALKEAGLRLP